MTDKIRRVEKRRENDKNPNLKVNVEKIKKKLKEKSEENNLHSVRLKQVNLPISLRLSA